MFAAWKGAFLEGTLVFQNDFSMSLELKSLFIGNYWMLTNVYAPCTAEGKRFFWEWFKNIQMPDEQDWLLVGDFNLMRSPENRNRDGGDINEMLLFNEAISALGALLLKNLHKFFKKSDIPWLIWSGRNTTEMVNSQVT